MKNLLYIFFTITLLGCSSDDNSSQTFFEKYDGVVWEEESTMWDPNYSYKFKLLNSPMTYLRNESNNSCEYYLFGEINQLDSGNTSQSIILENSEDTLVFEVTVKDLDEETITYIMTFTAVNNGKTLMLETSGDTIYQESYRRLNEPMSCN